MECWPRRSSPTTPNNASFAPTVEGTAPKIRMGIFTRGTSSLNDDLDSDYDGEVVFHEYGHGVSNRLVGAKVSVSCLNGPQSGAMGEGWSDYFSISYYNNPIEGAYLAAETGEGIRRQSYEGYTYTYEDIGNGNYAYEVHDDGEIWAATLWDLAQDAGPECHRPAGDERPQGHAVPPQHDRCPRRHSGRRPGHQRRR
jgi:hypothetical protein